VLPLNLSDSVHTKQDGDGRQHTRTQDLQSPIRIRSHTLGSEISTDSLPDTVDTGHEALVTHTLKNLRAFRSWLARTCFRVLVLSP